MARIKPYTLAQAQELVADAQRRMVPQHEEWSVLERLLASGTVEDFAASIGLETGEVAYLLRDKVGAAAETINLVLPHISIILASVIDRTPRLLCEPLRGGPEQAERAKTAEALINYYWRRTNATDALRDATQDMVVAGNGFLKVGWSYVETTVEPMRAGERQQLLDAAGAAEQAGQQAGILDLVQAVVESDEPFVTYVSPYDMFVPADARRLSETRWVAQRLRLPLAELKARDDLANLSTLVADSKATAGRSQPNRGTGEDQVGDVFDMVELFEFYDLRTHTMMVFQGEAAKPLFAGPIPYQHRHAPFVHLANFRSRGDEFWAFGELRNVAPLQMAYNEAIGEQMANFRRSGQKYLAHAELLTDDVIDALMSDTPDLVVRVNGDLLQDRAIGDLIAPVFRPPLPSDTYRIVDTMREGMSAVLGINDFQSGGMGADRMSATAAAVVDGVATLRAQDKISAVERAASQVGNLLLRLAQEFISPDTAVSIVGPNGEWVDARIREEMISGEFDVSVEGGSTQAVNPASRQRRAVERLNTLVPVLQQAGYDTEPLLRTIIADFDLDPNVVLRKPAPAPAPEGMAPPGAMPAGQMPAMPAGGPLADVPGMNLTNAMQGDMAL